MNTALGLENVNASGGVEHPPFHFDYLEVNDGTKNAHAFQHEAFSFIVVTMPLVQLLWDLSLRLSDSPPVLQLLGIDYGLVRKEAVHALLFQFQLTFLVSHEYTHHVHRHCDGYEDGMAGEWTEFQQVGTSGGMECQAQELDADAYAIYLVLANFVRGGGRSGALVQIEKQSLSGVEGDSLLLMYFVVAVTGLFCAFWSENIEMESVWQFRHPPAPVRIDYAIRVAQMWCGQNESVSQAWFAAERLQGIFRAVLQTIGKTTQEAWDAQISFLCGEEGKKYDRRLLELFETIRKNQRQSNEAAPVVGA